MLVRRSMKAFLEERLSCGQSVLRGFQELHGITEEEIAEAKKFGGGRAEGGICGALHAAGRLVGADEEKHRELQRGFVAQAGSVRCREIREQKRLSCAGCVELAAKILHGKQEE